MKTIAAITIGQSPRPEAVAELALFVPGVRWLEAGALDLLDEPAIARLAPEAGEFPLVTRLRSGATAVVGERAIIPLMQSAVNRVERESDVILTMCSGRFAITSRRPLVFPGPILAAAVGSLFAGQRVMVLTPLESQIGPQTTHWRRQGVDPVVRFASPYAETDFTLVGREARERGVAAVALDCFGYSLGMKAAVADASGLPTLLVRTLAARMVAELIGAGAGRAA